MGFELSQGSKMQAMEFQDFSLKLRSFEEVCSRHIRSKSCSGVRLEKDDRDNSSEAFHHLKLDMEKVKDLFYVKKTKFPATRLQSSLKKEILQLERHLQDQLVERHALEKALRYGASSHDATNQPLVSKPTKELIKEIAVLELEVVHLEQYLLSLYRKAFNQQISSSSPSGVDGDHGSPFITREQDTKFQTGLLIVPESPIISSMNISSSAGSIERTDHIVPCSHSSPSQLSIFSSKPATPVKNIAKGLWACHSLPLSLQENARNDTSNVISLAEHFGTRVEDLVPETPNRLSEKMIRCMGAIYCKISDPPFMHNGPSHSPPSSLSSMSAFSPHDQCDMWSPQSKKDSSFDERSENLFKIEEIKDFSGPYSTTVEVLWVSRDSQRLSKVEHMLQDFRSMVHRLEKVDLRNMKNEEKLAFWINIHNALVMHAYLADGVPQKSLKRGLLFMKAEFNVGGQTISADTIQTSILGCRTPRPGQWLRTFFPKMKFRGGDDQQSYAIEHPEPLVHFALCSGSHSDPAVRLYTVKRVFQELEAAKEEYFQSVVNIHKEHKILLPKTIESFAKESSLSSSELLEMIEHCLPETRRKVMQRCQQGKSCKNIEWVPHNFAFRYLLSKELAK